MTATPINNGNNDNGDGKITLALISQQIAHLAKDLNDFKVDLRKVDDCTDDLEVDHARLKTKVENLEGRVSSWSALNSVGVAVAAILATIGLGRP